MFGPRLQNSIAWCAVQAKQFLRHKNQLVQSSEPGVIRKRYVSEGDLVSKGQLLFDIDPIDAKAQLNQAQKRFSSLKVKSIRLKAEVSGELPDFPDLLMDTAPNAISTELALYQS